MPRKAQKRRTREIRMHAEPIVDTARLDRIYHVHTHDKITSAYVHAKTHKTIRILRGALVIDGQTIGTADFGHDVVSWSEWTQDGYSSGQLYFSRGGTELSGILCAGASPDDAQVDNVLATSVMPITYHTRLSRSRQKAGTDPATLPETDWQDGFALTMGYALPMGASHPQPVVTLNGIDVTDAVAFSIDPKTNATVLTLIGPQMEMFCDLDDTLYKAFSIAFDDINPGFAGAVTAMCSDTGNAKGAFLWSGTAAGPGAFAAARVAADVPPRPMGILLNQAAAGLKITELLGIVADQSVAKTANDFLIENTKFAMGQDPTETKWLATFMGEKTPDLCDTTPATCETRKALVTKGLDWYQKEFAVGYLGWSISNYSGANAPTTRLSDAQKLKLKYFMQTGLAKTKEFSIQQNGIYIDAFISSKPRLKDFIDDTAGNWGQTLYDMLVEPARLTQDVNRVWGAVGDKGAMDPINARCTLLSALQPSGLLAKAYMQAVTTGVVTKSVTSLSFADKDVVNTWMPDWLEQFLDVVASDGAVPDQARIVGEQIRQLVEAHNGSLTATASELSDVLVNANGSDIFNKTTAASLDLRTKYPKLSALGDAFFFMAWTMGLVSVISALRDWKNLTPKQKAAAVLSAIQTGLSSLDVVPNLLKGVKALGEEGWTKFTEWRLNNKPMDDVDNMIEMDDVADANWMHETLDELTPLMDVEKGVIEVEGTAWAKLYAGAGKVVGVLGIIISAAFAVLSTITFVDDIKSGAPIAQTVLDGIVAAANIAMAVISVISLVVSSVVFAIAAAVLAVLGAIVSLIESLVVKPPNPLEDFMKDVLVPFVDALPKQDPPPSGGTTTAFHVVV